MPPKRLSPAKMKDLCQAFNAQHKIGDTIRVWPGAVAGEPVERTIVSPGAVVMGGHTPVVYVSGGGGCIALTHVLG